MRNVDIDCQHRRPVDNQGACILTDFAKFKVTMLVGGCGRQFPSLKQIYIALNVDLPLVRFGLLGLLGFFSSSLP